MKFAVAPIFAALFAASPLGQAIFIDAPMNMASVTRGSQLVVELDQPDSPTSWVEVAVVIAIASCPITECRPPNETLGTILYNGSFNPQFTPLKVPNQKFTVEIPSNFPKGRAHLAVFHVALIGAGPEPFTETTNITLSIR